jgi:hypothetical protein
MGWWMENAWDKMEDEQSEYTLIGVFLKLCVYEV